MSIRVIHVDDDKDVRASVKMILEAEGGFELHSFADAEMMLAQFEGTKFDLAILDVMVEEQDAGLKAYDRIRDKYPDVPIIIMTSLGEMILPYFEDRAEMPWIMDKPVTPEKLLGTIKMRLRSAGQNSASRG